MVSTSLQFEIARSWTTSKQRPVQLYGTQELVSRQVLHHLWLSLTEENLPLAGKQALVLLHTSLIEQLSLIPDALLQVMLETVGFFACLQ